MTVLPDRSRPLGGPDGGIPPPRCSTASVRVWLVHGIVLLIALLAPLAAQTARAAGLQAIEIDADTERIELTDRGVIYEGRGDALQVETAPDAGGATFRMSVKATTPGTNPNWIVFALRNTSDKPIERWLTAERFTLAGSGVVWPDLDARRVEAVTPSVGFLPERVKSDRADIFRISIAPGQTVTLVAELSSERFARLYLWKPLDLEARYRDRQLVNGILLGITGLLAIFLTAVFAANHRVIFPASALVAWCVLALLCVDFGFWHKLFPMRPEDNAQYRAVAESAVAASLVLFLFVFLRGNLWHGFIRMLFVIWMVGQGAIVATAVLDPRLAATVARMSLGVIGVVGGLAILYLALKRLDRALALAPTWILLLVWLFGAGLTVTGRLHGEMATSGLSAGLVLIMVILGFTVTQFAFRAVEPAFGANLTDQQLRSAAIETAGVGVWEWSARRDEIKIDPIVEMALGLNAGDLSGKVEDLLGHMHPGDRERLQLALTSIKEQSGGTVRLDLRLRHVDSTYRWLELDGASVPTTDMRSLRCVGLVRDVTDAKRGQERLLHDAVHDSLTGLPNRQLFLDRLGVALRRARDEPAVRPTVLLLDLDKFKSVNSSFGLVVGDSLLLTVARRLARSLAPQDTLARIGGDQFGILILSDHDPRDLAMIAERVRRSLRSPIKIAGQDIVLTGSVGIAVFDLSQETEADLLREAETAMYRAKRAGTDRIEIFTPQMRGEKDERIAIESELRRAIDQRQLKILYQPIVGLSTENIQGFEALVRWEHPRLGLLSPGEFIPVAEETDLIARLGSFVLARAVEDLVRWHKEHPRPDRPLFVSVNLSSRQLLRPELVPEIRNLLGRAVLPRGALRLEITESLVMENPEHATHVLELLRDCGADLALDDFGTGYSSLAYLQRFPFDTIKIDKALVQAGTEDQASAAIVRSIVALAHELGRSVVAEGVEAAEDAAFLRSLGCEYAQGYYYGEPMPDRDVVQLLRMLQKSERRMRRRGLVRGRAGSERTETPVTDKAPSAVKETTAPPPRPQPVAAVAASATEGTAPVVPPPMLPRSGTNGAQSRPLSTPAAPERSEPVRPLANGGAANGSRPPPPPVGQPPHVQPPPVQQAGVQSPPRTQPVMPAPAIAARIDAAASSMPVPPASPPAATPTTIVHTIPLNRTQPLPPRLPDAPPRSMPLPEVAPGVPPHVVAGMTPAVSVPQPPSAAAIASPAATAGEELNALLPPKKSGNGSPVPAGPPPGRPEERLRAGMAATHPPTPDLVTLSPALAASLARLAGASAPLPPGAQPGPSKKSGES